MKKKEFIIDGKKQTYYEKIDAAYGCLYTFSNIGNSFVVLTGKIAGKVIGPSPYEVYGCSLFKTLNELSAENDYEYDYNKFMNKYREDIGAYFTYDSHDMMYNRITDQELLQKIRSTTKDYDDTILNNNTDISQMYSAINLTRPTNEEKPYVLTKK